MWIQLPAVHVDALADIVAGGPTPVLLDLSPANAATAVVRSIQPAFVLVDTGDDDLALVTQVAVQEGTGPNTTIFDRAVGPAFSAPYVGSTFTPGTSPGGPLGEIDEHAIVLVRSTDWPSGTLITITVRGRTTLQGALTSFAFSFTIEDYVAPTLVSAATRGLRTLRVGFSEAVLRPGTHVAGDARSVREITGNVEFALPNLLRAPGGNFTAADVFRFVHVTGARDVRNDRAWRIDVINSSTEVVLGVETGGPIQAETNSEARVSVSPYRLSFVVDLLVPAFEPIQVGADAVAAADVVGTPDGTAYVDLHFADDLSPDRAYVLTIDRIADLAGNLSIDNAANFRTEAIPLPARFYLDPVLLLPPSPTGSTDDNVRTANLLRELVLLVLQEVRRLNTDLDPDLARNFVLDVLLNHLGNPFTFAADLGDLHKRRLIDSLAEAYRGKGTELILEQVLTFFFGNTFDVRPYQAMDAWELDVDLLDLSAFLGVDTRFLRYAFEVVNTTPGAVLTVAERRQLTEVVDQLRTSHTHFVRYLETP